MRISSKQMSYQGSWKLFKNKGARAEIVATVCLILSVRVLKKRANFQDLNPRNSICCILTVDLNQLSKGRFTGHFNIKMESVISYSLYHIKAYFSKKLAGVKDSPWPIFATAISHILDFNKFH